MAAGLERWRELLRGVDIFDVIDHAILVAAADSPHEFRRRRDRIAERLFTAATALPSLSPGASAGEGNCSVRRVAEESKVGSSNGSPEVGDDDDNDFDGERMRRAAASNYGHTYDDDDEDEDEKEEANEADLLEALTEEIEKESQVVTEVLRIKELLVNQEEQSADLLFESLRRLQLMQLSVETLKATEIGRAVSGLRKHSSQEIRHLAHTLVEDWKVLVDEWVSATNAAITDTSPDSSNPSVVIDDDEEEEGLPSPPLDEGAFFVTQTTIQQLSELFDEMDDDGNLRNSKNNKGGLWSKSENNGGWHPNPAPVRKQQTAQALLNTDEKTPFMRQQLPARQEPSLTQTNPQNPQGSRSQMKPPSVLSKQNKPLCSESEHGRPFEATPQQKPSGDMKPRQTRDSVAVARKPTVSHVDKLRMPAQASEGPKVELAKRKLYEGLQEDNMALEVTKRKLHERYQEAENAKKQRTIQVMELHDIPKPKHQSRNPLMKSRNHIRSWANGRR